MNPFQDDPAFTLFEELLSLPSPSGREQRLAALIRGKVELLGYTTEIDAAGNVIIELPGSVPDAPLTAYAAHMDEIGFTVTHIAENGDLRVIRSGGLFPWKAGESPVEILSDDNTTITGVLSFGSTHGWTGSAEVTWEQARVVTGRSAAELKAAGIGPGAAGTLARHVCQPVVLGEGPDPLVGAWTFDDRMGCVMLLLLLEDLARDGLRPAAPTLVAFTTREEVGGYGASYLAHQRRPEVMIAVDGAPLTADVDLLLDGRPAIWARDSLGPYDHALLLALKEAAAAAGTEAQIAAYGSSASDASLAQRAGGVGRAACFGHPRENSHGFEIVRRSTFGHIRATLRSFATSWCG